MCTHQVSDETLALQTRGLDKLEYVCSLLNLQPLQLRVDGHEGSCPTHSITEWKKRQKLLILLITITSIGLEIIKSFVSVTSLLSCLAPSRSGWGDLSWLMSHVSQQGSSSFHWVLTCSNLHFSLAFQCYWKRPLHVVCLSHLHITVMGPSPAWLWHFLTLSISLSRESVLGGVPPSGHSW